MEEGITTSPCKECDAGAGQAQCCAHLRSHLAERDAAAAAREAALAATNAQLQEQTDIWREKYERLYSSYSRVHRLNQTLEERLLGLAEQHRGAQAQLGADVATLSLRLAHTKHSLHCLHKENERYKNDMNLAIQLLQCKPDNFVSHKLDNLPLDTQTRVSQFVMTKTKSSPNLPSKNGNEEPVDTTEYEFNVSASLMAKILEDSMRDTVTKHCETCTCTNSRTNLFSYDETHYSVGTQTTVHGEMKNSLCLNCNGDVKSVQSNISNRSGSPQVHRLYEERNATPKILSQSLIITPRAVSSPAKEKIVKENDIVNDRIKMEEKRKLIAVQKEIDKEIGVEFNNLNENFTIEPATHHRLCDRTKSSTSNIDPNLLDEPKLGEVNIKDLIERKNSYCSGGEKSRASSTAKSTTSTHKSNTHVGPGPRFCSLRVQAGSKNILLDNAQPDVPPILYKRQSRCPDLLNDEVMQLDEDNKDENENVETTHVVESTLVDVHVDASDKEDTTEVASVNPVIMNVSNSPLEPLKAHTFNNPQNAINIKPDILKQSENVDLIDILNNKPNVEIKCNGVFENSDNPSINMQGVKIFNFDLYEQNMTSNQFARPLRKIDMSQIVHIENTKISKDLPPVENIDQLNKSVKPSNVNVYSNVAQTHKAMNKPTEQSTSSLSSDGSAALLQKQQLLRVAEWVQQNLEQQINFSAESTEPFLSKLRRDSKNNIKDVPLKMPHPVTKFSTYEDGTLVDGRARVLSNTIVKETVFPVECDSAPQTSDQDSSHTTEHRPTLDKLSAEELARMEYNVKKFLLSGSPWSQAADLRPAGAARTSSKTETDL